MYVIIDFLVGGIVNLTELLKDAGYGGSFEVSIYDDTEVINTFSIDTNEIPQYPTK